MAPYDAASDICHARLYFKALEQNTTLVSLDVSRCALTDAAAATVGWMLSENLGLRNLRCGYNRFGPRGARAVAEGLLLNRTLRHLDLDHNWGLGDAGAAYLGGCLAENEAGGLLRTSTPPTLSLQLLLRAIV